MKIGLMMVVRNESKRIKEFLDWHLPYFDEVAICDQESDDDTWDILKDYKKKSKIPFHIIQDKAWGHCEPSRQQTADLLETDWILYADPDEKFPVEFLKEMHKIIDNPNYSGYLFPRKNVFNVQVYNDNVPIQPKYLQIRHPARDDQLRLTLKAVSTFNNLLHNRVRVSGKTSGGFIGYLPYEIEHSKDISEQWEDNKRYSNYNNIKLKKEKKHMKIWISGASGFIGKNTAEECLRRGYKVMCFDRIKHEESIKGIEYFMGDIRDRNAVDESLSLCDAGIDLAGILGTAENVDNPFPAVETNIMGGLNFFEACRKHKKRGVQITVGNWWMNNTYSITKSMLERFALMYNKEHGTKIALVRGLSVYGEGQKHKPIRKIAPNFICKALRGEKINIFGSGETVQDQVYVKDIAYILVEALVNEKTRFDKVYSAGTGVKTTVNQIAELVNRLTGNKAGVEHTEMRKGEEDLSVILGEPETLSELGDIKFTPIEEGYKKTIEWYKNNYNWQND